MNQSFLKGFFLSSNKSKILFLCFETCISSIFINVSGLDKLYSKWRWSSVTFVFLSFFLSFLLSFFLFANKKWNFLKHLHHFVIDEQQYFFIFFIFLFVFVLCKFFLDVWMCLTFPSKFTTQETLYFSKLNFFMNENVDVFVVKIFFFRQKIWLTLRNNPHLFCVLNYLWPDFSSLFLFFSFWKTNIVSPSSIDEIKRGVRDIIQDPIYNFVWNKINKNSIKPPKEVTLLVQPHGPSFPKPDVPLSRIWTSVHPCLLITFKSQAWDLLHLQGNIQTFCFCFCLQLCCFIFCETI